MALSGNLAIMLTTAGTASLLQSLALDLNFAPENACR